MAAIFAQMHGNAIGAAQMRLDGSPYRIRFIGLTRLAHGGNMVNIDAEFNHLEFLQVDEDLARMDRSAVQVMTDNCTGQSLRLMTGLGALKLTRWHVIRVSPRTPTEPSSGSLDDKSGVRRPAI